MDWTVGTIAGSSNPAAKVGWVARNLIVDRHRRASVRSIEIPLDCGQPGLPAQMALAEQQVGVCQELELFGVALSRLPSRVREAIVLRRIGYLSQREAAGRMEISEKAIERYLALSLRFLAASLRETSIPTGRYKSSSLPTDTINLPAVVGVAA